MDKNFNLSFKKNSIEKLLLNLDQNPYSQKNKDFRYTLSLIYELIEEEFKARTELSETIKAKLILTDESTTVEVVDEVFEETEEFDFYDMMNDELDFY